MRKLNKLIVGLNPRKKQEKIESPQKNESTVSYKREASPKGMSKQQQVKMCQMLLQAAQITEENRKKHAPRNLEERITKTEVVYTELDFSGSSNRSKAPIRQPETIYATLKVTHDSKNIEPIYENLKSIPQQVTEPIYESVFPWGKSENGQPKVTLQGIKQVKENLGACPKQPKTNRELGYER